MHELDAEEIRKDFPILNREFDGKRLVYLDSAATSQKPVQVISKVREYYENYNANIHRGIYKISEEATEAYIESKRKAARFINAGSYDEIVYTKNATDSINLVALSWAEQNIKRGDHILITEMEHHSNIVPWQMLVKRKNAVLDYISVDSSKTKLDEASIEAQLSKNPKILAITSASNVLGTINDVKGIARKAHEHGAVVIVDGAQSVPHMPVDVSDMGADFFAFSSHKMLGPAGLGVLHARRELLEGMPPVTGGGDMILTVDKDNSTWNELPWKFEAGTPNIEGAIGLGAAIDYLGKVGMEKVRSHETGLTKYALDSIAKVEKVEVFGPGVANIGIKNGIISFTVEGVHPHDVAAVFDSEGVAIRAGHHCAMPLIRSVLKLPAVSRMSFYIYNTEQDIDSAIKAINSTKRTFHVR